MTFAKGVGNGLSVGGDPYRQHPEATLAADHDVEGRNRLREGAAQRR
jgi:hypothetical protein